MQRGIKGWSSLKFRIGIIGKADIGGLTGKNDTYIHLNIHIRTKAILLPPPKIIGEAWSLLLPPPPVSTPMQSVQPIRYFFYFFLFWSQTLQQHFSSCVNSIKVNYSIS